MNTPEPMTHPTFDDLTPPPQIVLAAFGRCFVLPDGVAAIARWGAEQAADRLKGQWPTPITDRAPTEADADDKCHVQVLNHCGTWGWSGWRDVAGRPWLHTPRWQPPAPPTLKEQALKVLKPPIPAQLHDGSRILKPHEIDLLLRALEADS